MYKKVYIEITNNCNLSCSFCMHNKRKSAFMDLESYKVVIDKIKEYSKYVYLHVLGEPLLHPNINEIIDINYENGINTNITTNGYLISRIKDNHHIRQINISLQSFNDNYDLSMDEYFVNIFEVINNLKKDTYFNLRLWVDSNITRKMLTKINTYYNKNILFNNNNSSIKLEDNVYLTFHKEFSWPSLNSEEKYEHGTCYALRDHLGILVDGTIVPCCLDGDGSIKLGNIFSDSLNDVINSQRYQRMMEGFKNNKKIEPLCQRCNFIEK